MSSELKKDFPIFASKQAKGEPYIYLDSAATTQKPQSMIDAIVQFYAHNYATVHRALYSSSQDVTRAYDEARVKAQAWLKAAHYEEIVFTRGTTSALNMLASSMSQVLFPQKGAVLVSEVEHHANILPWEMACRRVHGQVKKIRVDEQGFIDLNHLETLVKQGASVVCIHHVSNVTGAIQPLKQIIQCAHDHGVYVVVDGAQGIAHIPTDVVDLDIDFYAFSGHKLYGPTGVGVLYGKKELLEQLPPVEGGGDMVDIYHADHPTFLPAPLKFEAGTPPIASILGLGASFDYLQSLPLTVFQEESELTEFMHRQLLAIPGVRVIGPEIGQPRGALTSITIEGVHPMDVGYLLDLQGIAVRTGHQCAQPAMSRWELGHVLRASLGIYNNQEDINAFICALQSTITQLRR